MHRRLASPLVIEQETKEAGLIRYALSSLFDPIRTWRHASMEPHQLRCNSREASVNAASTTAGSRMLRPQGAAGTVISSRTLGMGCGTLG